MRYNINDVDVIAVKNGLFGGKVTVSGLLGGKDLENALRGKQAERLLITASMLKADEDVFLDDISLCELEGKIGMRIHPVQNTGEALLCALLGYE